MHQIKANLLLKYATTNTYNADATNIISKDKTKQILSLHLARLKRKHEIKENSF